VPESEAKPRATTSALNAAIEHAAGRLGIDMSDVVVDWYDFVVGDEPLGSAKRSAEPSSPPAQSPPDAAEAELELPCVMQRELGGSSFEIEMSPTSTRGFVDLAVVRVLGATRAHYLTGYISHDGFAEFEVCGGLSLSSREFESHVAIVRLLADEVLPACRRWLRKISLPSDELYLRGYVRWDGCSEIRFGDYHWCGWKDWRKHMELLSHLYLRAFELMGVEPNEHCDAEGLAVYRAAVAARDGAERQG
jgi:hypothetical protein